MPRAGGLRGGVGELGRILLGPWPLYPVATLLVVLFSLLIRSLVRVQSQPVGAAPVVEMIPGVVLVAVATTASVMASLWAVPRAIARIAPLGGRPPGRARYVLTLLIVCLITALALAVTRFGFPDGGPPIQVSPLLVTFNTVIVVVIAVYITNGVTAYAVDRLRRQEAVIAQQLRRERSEMLAAEERVRAETARALHDDMQSTLLRASMRLADLERDAVDADAARRLRVVIDEVDEVREHGIRGIGRRLSPPLESTGLVVALGELAASYAGVMAVDVEVDDAARARFRIVGSGDRLALGVYRIAEQGLQNALKHGGARRASVVLGLCADGVAELRVEADGVSPAPDRVPGDGSAIVNAWLDDLGGEWALGPGPDTGSLLVARVGRSGGGAA